MTKVAILRCEDYKSSNVCEAVKKATDLIGGIGSFVKPGMKVLLKPNLLSPRPPEDAVTTHPEVVRAVARLVKSAGGVVSLGDAPGGYGKNIDEILEISGIGKIAVEEGIRIKKFTAPRFVEGFPIARDYFESDLVISIPKFKTHMITVITAAVKNTFGMVVGPHKAECHSRAPKEKDFAPMIAKVYSIAKPHLTVLDGITGMEGDGPSAGTARKMNLIMAGADAVAIDACVAKIIGLEPHKVLVTKEAAIMGLGESDLAKIEVAGGRVEDFISKDFKLPGTTPMKFIPGGIIGALSALIKFKPYIDSGLCKRCNLCKLSCPVDCITITKEYCKIDYKKCVKCLCCHEVCPYNAVCIKRNFLTRMMWG